MGDIYVVSAGARERLLAAAGYDEDCYVVRAGLEPELLAASAAVQPPRGPAEPSAYRVRASVAVPSGLGRE